MKKEEAHKPRCTSHNYILLYRCISLTLQDVKGKSHSGIGQERQPRAAEFAHEYAIATHRHCGDPETAPCRKSLDRKWHPWMGRDDDQQHDRRPHSMSFRTHAGCSCCDCFRLQDVEYSTVASSGFTWHQTVCQGKKFVAVEGMDGEHVYRDINQCAIETDDSR